MRPRLTRVAATGRRWAALAVLAVVTALPAEAQRAREEAQLAPERRALERRHREVLHGGDPHHLVGVGAGDPEALTRTPALASATLGLVRVDRDELYARKLAMYEGAPPFDAAPRTLGPVVPDTRRDAARHAAPGAAREAPYGDDSWAPAWPWVAGALAALALLLRRAVVGRGRAPAPSKKR